MLQKNAHVSDALVMRVGIPHRNGKLVFHAFDKGYSALVSANAFWNQTKKEFNFPDITGLSELDFAMDSAGFTAVNLWQTKGRQDGMAGIYPWSYSQYIEMATQCGCNWWAQPDLCCEPAVAADQAAIDFRVNATATLLEGTLRILYDWQSQLAVDATPTTVANMLPPPVPVIQGWKIDDYLRSLDMLVNVWERWQPWLAPPVLIGLGSVCRRDVKHPTHGLYAILDALEGRLPSGARLHLFGVKGTCLSELKMRKDVASVDSMAYDFSARVKAREAGISNTLEHRTREMTRWMEQAEARMRPGGGDQFRLALNN